MTRDVNLENKISTLLDSRFEILAFDELGSTNSFLKELALKGANEGTVVISRSQTSGRGRLGRSFQSDRGGLYLSLLLRPERSTENALLITVAAAVAVANAVEEISSNKCEIKWVNDVFIGGKKISGILTEGAINPQNGKLDYAVLGIGVNICEPEYGFREEIKNIAAPIFKECDIDDVLPRLAALIVNKFNGFYRNLGDKEYLDEYKSRSMLIGKTVSYEKDNVLYIANVKDIDDNAGLVLEQNGQTLILTAGEVSVRVL